jgi:hypothetical protein
MIFRIGRETPGFLMEIMYGSCAVGTYILNII